MLTSGKIPSRGTSAGSAVGDASCLASPTTSSEGLGVLLGLLGCGGKKNRPKCNTAWKGAGDGSCFDSKGEMDELFTATKHELGVPCEQVTKCGKNSSLDDYFYPV